MHFLQGREPVILSVLSLLHQSGLYVSHLLTVHQSINCGLEARPQCDRKGPFDGAAFS